MNSRYLLRLCLFTYNNVTATIIIATFLILEALGLLQDETAINNLAAAHEACK